MTDYYKGKIVPEVNGLGMELNCFNSLCFGVDCIECIHFPMGETVIIKHEYLQEINQDEYISEGIERVSDGD